VPKLLRAAAFSVVAFSLVCAPTALEAHRAPSLSIGTVLIDGRVVRYVIARLDRVRVHAALGGAEVGETAWLADIAKRDNAIAAINGGYFEAYAKHVPRRNLDQTTIIDGSMIFKGDVGDVLYFDRENRASIGRVPLRIAGTLDGGGPFWNTWYAYWFNRLPGPVGSTITIFTPAWGSATGLQGGPQVQVTDGVVSAINWRSTSIPRNGYVIYFRGEWSVAFRFWKGRHVAYTVKAATPGFIHAWQAIGGGPQLLLAGDEFVNPRAEGFHDPKMFGSGKRSMVGVNAAQTSLIFAVAYGSLSQCAHIMKELGAYNAMSLDGGASSALWANGHYLVSPGRRINNALVLTRSY
jgi:hypothetical protein